MSPTVQSAELVVEDPNVAITVCISECMPMSTCQQSLCAFRRAGVGDKNINIEMSLRSFRLAGLGNAWLLSLALENGHGSAARALL